MLTLRALALAGASVGLAALVPRPLTATPRAVAPPATLTVQNDRRTPATVYVQQGAFDLPAGTVPAQSTGTLPLSQAMVADRRDVRIVVHPHDGFDVVTRRVDVQPGAHMGVLVPRADEAISRGHGVREPTMLDPHPRSRATSLTVQNDGSRKVDVFVERGPFDTRLGSVAPHAASTLRIPPWFVDRDDVVLLADRENGLDFQSRRLHIEPHHHLGMIIPAR